MLKHIELNPRFVDAAGLMLTLAPSLSVIALGSVVGIAVVPWIRRTKRNKKGSPSDIKEQEEDALSRADIGQIDASVIAGVIVFLTLGGLQLTEESQVTMITASIIFPFALSAMVAVLSKQAHRLAIRLMVAGFINLAISVILVVLIKST